MLILALLVFADNAHRSICQDAAIKESNEPSAHEAWDRAATGIRLGHKGLQVLLEDLIQHGLLCLAPTISL